jgi:hypothetical protein
MIRDARLEFKTRELTEADVAIADPHNRQKMAEDRYDATVWFLNL